MRIAVVASSAEDISTPYVEEEGGEEEEEEEEEDCEEEDCDEVLFVSVVRVAVSDADEVGNMAAAAAVGSKPV